MSINHPLTNITFACAEPSLDYFQHLKLHAHVFVVFVLSPWGRAYIYIFTYLPTIDPWSWLLYYISLWYVLMLSCALFNRDFIHCRNWGWTAYGDGYGIPEVTKRNGICTVEGRLREGSSWGDLAQLPPEPDLQSDPPPWIQVFFLSMS